MLALIIIGVIVAVGYEAIKHFKADNYANQVVNGEKTNFSDFMFSNYPILTVIAIILVLLIIASIIHSAVRTDRCPRCGEITYTGDYCFECQAEQARQAAGLTYHCQYPNCPSYTTGSTYCSQHTCSVDGCDSKVCDPIAGYCTYHNRIRKRTCAEPGCNRNVSVENSEKYCGLHYWDREH